MLKENKKTPKINYRGKIIKKSIRNEDFAIRFGGEEFLIFLFNIDPLNAIKKANKQNEIALICFDAEPEFLEMIQNGDLVASAMQQPYIIGQEAVVTLNNYFNNKEVKKEQKMEILSISKENIDDKLKIIKLNVLGIKSDEK